MNGLFVVSIRLSSSKLLIGLVLSVLAKTSSIQDKETFGMEL